jgi:hypothetical protein
MEEEKKIKYICMHIRYKEKITAWRGGGSALVVKRGGSEDLRPYYSIN